MENITEEQLKSRIEKLEMEIEVLKRTQARLSLPETNVISHNFLTRAFAIFGHYLVAGFLVSIAFYCIFFAIILALGISLDTLF